MLWVCSDTCLYLPSVANKLPSSLPVVTFTALSCQELKGREETQVLVPNVLTKECLQLLEKEGLQAIPESWSLPHGIYFIVDSTQ